MGGSNFDVSDLQLNRTAVPGESFWSLWSPCPEATQAALAAALFWVTFMLRLLLLVLLIEQPRLTFFHNTSSELGPYTHRFEPPTKATVLRGTFPSCTHTADTVGLQWVLHRDHCCPSWTLGTPTKSLSHLFSHKGKDALRAIQVFIIIYFLFLYS